MRDTDNDFVIVIGNSHVRSFSGSTIFLPVFLGPGREMCFRNSECSENVLKHVHAVLSHIGTKYPILFVFSEPEIRLFIESDPEPSEQVIDRFLTSVTSEMAAFIRKCKLEKIDNFAVFNSIPRNTATHNHIALQLNTHMSRICQELSVPFIDIWRHLIEKDSGLVKPSLNADGIHLTHQAIVPTVDALKEIGFLDTAALGFADYKFADRHVFKLGGERTIKVWGDIQISAKTDAKISSYVSDSVAKFLKSRLRSRGSILVIGAKDGYLPFALSGYTKCRIFATEANTTRRNMAVRLQHLFLKHTRIYFSCEVPDRIRTYGIINVHTDLEKFEITKLGDRLVSPPDWIVTRADSALLIKTAFPSATWHEAVQIPIETGPGIVFYERQKTGLISRIVRAFAR